MQLFGLVNTMLAHDRTTAERDLSIARYAVIPLSPNSGVALHLLGAGRSSCAPVLDLQCLMDAKDGPSTALYTCAHC